MIRALLVRRWSTLTLLGVSVGLSTFTWNAGQKTVVERAPNSTAPAPVSPPESAPDTTASPRADPVESRSRDAVTTVSANDHWARWSAKARTPDNEREMTAFVEELAARDPKQAMLLALGEGNLRLRQNLRNAVLRGWATVFPQDASAWALALPDGDRQVAMEAVFAGAAQRPEEAARLGQRLCAQDPAHASDYGQFLITGLTAVGAYETAARFAAADTSSARAAWLSTTFFQWATHQPQNALTAFASISAPATRSAAFQGMVSGWAMADPASLVSYAMTLPPGEDRSHALSQALPQWVGRDTLVASEWINQLDSNPDLDTGVASVATLSNLVNQRPEVAVGWAESIAEPVLRANTLWMIAQQWARNDPDGIRRFIASTPDLAANDRRALLDAMNPPPEAY